jgi:hypothetical protein
MISNFMELIIIIQSYWLNVEHHQLKKKNPPRFRGFALYIFIKKAGDQKKILIFLLIKSKHNLSFTILIVLSRGGVTRYPIFKSNFLCSVISWTVNSKDPGTYKNAAYLLA